MKSAPLSRNSNILESWQQGPSELRGKSRSGILNACGRGSGRASLWRIFFRDFPGPRAHFISASSTYCIPARGAPAQSATSCIRGAVVHFYVSVRLQLFIAALVQPKYCMQLNAEALWTHFRPRGFGLVGDRSALLGCLRFCSRMTLVLINSQALRTLGAAKLADPISEPPMASTISSSSVRTLSTN